MVLVDFSGKRGDVLLDRLAFADSLENEILHILVESFVNVVDVVQAEK
jgi:hypothetical protein